MDTDFGARLVDIFREVCETDPLLEESLRLAGDHLARAAICDAAVDEYGPLIKGTRGTLVANPMLSEARHSRVAAFAILREVMPDAAPDDVVAAASTGQKDPAKQRAALVRWERARARSGATDTGEVA
ncbi:hypothetical protein [Nocardiopsis dassonvillei]|uniref:hypothetical protein n=1 Tax=Nocardiopsis dassonvillei TaxID=2014 RepID=UPI003642D9D7